MIKKLLRFFRKEHPLDKLTSETKQYCVLWSVVDAKTGKDIGTEEGCGILRNGHLIDITGKIKE